MSIQNYTFLLVDSDALSRKLVRDCLERNGFTNSVFEASNVNQAVAVLNENKISFVISDWTLPEANGFSLLKLIKRQERFKDMYFILLSRVENNEAEKVKRAALIGVDGYLLKPFDEKKFEALMSDIFESGKKGN